MFFHNLRVRLKLQCAICFQSTRWLPARGNAACPQQCPGELHEEAPEALPALVESGDLNTSVPLHEPPVAFGCIHEVPVASGLTSLSAGYCCGSSAPTDSVLRRSRSTQGNSEAAASTRCTTWLARNHHRQNPRRPHPRRFWPALRPAYHLIVRYCASPRGQRCLCWVELGASGRNRLRCFWSSEWHRRIALLAHKHCGGNCERLRWVGRQPAPGRMARSAPIPGGAVLDPQIRTLQCQAFLGGLVLNSRCSCSRNSTNITAEARKYRLSFGCMSTENLRQA